jgi:peptidase E
MWNGLRFVLLQPSKEKMKKEIFFLAFVSLFFLIAGCVLAHQPQIVYLQPGDIGINNPEISRAFYDELKGSPRDYFIDSSKDFELYINLLVPEEANRDGRYSADVFDNSGQKIYSLDGSSFDWQEYFEPFGRDYYLKGPEFDKQLPAGKYKIEIYSNTPAGGNIGKYVLAVGKTESYDWKSILNIYWQLPFLKITFFKTSVLQFFFTPFGIAGVGAIGGLLVLIFLINYLVALVKDVIKHSQAKTLLLASSFPQMKDEIIKLLQKPAYDVTVAFITTAAKPEENLDYLKNDWSIMKDEMGFNLEEIDIEGKKEGEVMKLLELKDIIFVEGGNTFYLLKAVRGCNFEKVIRKLLKSGKVYIGVSAGSIVAGRTVKTAGWKHDKNFVDLKDLRGLNLVPFDIFVHYQPEHAEIIKQKIKNPKKRAKKLRILADGQALLVQGREVDLIGDGEAVII